MTHKYSRYNRIIGHIIFLWISFLFTNCCYATSIIGNKKIQELLDDFRKSSNAPAAVLSIRSDNEISNYVSGNVKKITPKNPNPPAITTNNLFQIGSITKSFTSVIILQLEAEGKLSINDTIFDITKIWEVVTKE